MWPLFDRFPKDAEESYCQEYEVSLANRKQLFIVCEILHERKEKRRQSSERERRIVGFAVWNLAKGSPLVTDGLAQRCLR